MCLTYYYLTRVYSHPLPATVLARTGIKKKKKSGERKRAPIRETAEGCPREKDERHLARRISGQPIGR